MKQLPRAQAYLHDHYSAKTAARYLVHWREFEQYIQQGQSSLQGTNHQHILDYIQHLQSRKISAQQINKLLHLLEQLLGHLYPNQSNPVRGLRLRQGARSSLSEPIPEGVLLEVLQGWPRSNPKEKQDHLLLTLLHYQALRGQELGALRLEHVDVNQGMLTIPSCSRSASRELLLKDHQVPLFQVHLKETRRSLGGPRVTEGYLFSSGGQDAYFTNTLQRLKRQAQRAFTQKEYTLKNLEHWRSSRIVQLLERLPLLEVQALVGHKYASSTERYQLQGIEQLSEALRWHHPLEQWTP